MYFGVPSKVLLPSWVFEREGDAEYTLKLAHNYVLPRYKNYVIDLLEKPYAICRRLS